MIAGCSAAPGGSAPFSGNLSTGMACVNRQFTTVLCNSISHFEALSSVAQSKMVNLLLKEGKSKSFFFSLIYKSESLDFPFLPDNSNLPFPDFLESYVLHKAVSAGAGQDPCTDPF